MPSASLNEVDFIFTILLTTNPEKSASILAPVQQIPGCHPHRQGARAHSTMPIPRRVTQAGPNRIQTDVRKLLYLLTL